MFINILLWKNAFTAIFMYKYIIIHEKIEFRYEFLKTRQAVGKKMQAKHTLNCTWKQFKLG